MKKLIYTFTFVFLIYGLTFAQNNYYVDPNGNDTNNGTSELTPWKTISKACSTVVAGSTVFIKAGTYNEINNINCTVQGTPNNFITFRNYYNDTVILKRTGSDSARKMIVLLNKSYIRFVGLRISGFGYSWGGGISIDGNSHHIEIINCEFDHLNGMGGPIIADIYGNHNNLLLRNNKFHDCQIPQFGAAILLYTGYGDSIKILKNEIYNFSNTSPNPGTKAIIIQGRDSINSYKNMLIDSNIVHNCLIHHGEAISTSGNAEYFTISHNFVYNINNIGIGIAGGYTEPDWPNSTKNYSRYFNISDNVVYNCREDSTRAAGIYIDGGSYNVVERNIVFECNQGINIGCEHSNWFARENIIRDNNVYNCDRAGILIGQYEPYLGTVINCKVLNNTLFKNFDSSIIINEYGADFGCSRSTNCIFKNNIVYKSVRSNDNVKRLISVQTGSTGNIFDYNIYWFPMGPNFVTIDYPGVVYYNYQSYLNGTKQDSHSVFINPNLVDTNISSLNLHLRNNSPARDSGDINFIIGQNEKDIDRESRVYNGRVDCGSDEYQPINSVIPISNLIPNSFSLMQNYPNPFNPKTKIKFDVVRLGEVKIIVYDVTGREIQTLVNESLKPGTYETSFDGSTLNSGVYFYKLITDGFTETKKMLLIK